MGEFCNQVVELDEIRGGWSADFQPLAGLTSTEERITWMEGYLLKRLDVNRCNPDLFQSVCHILSSSGRGTVKEICEYSCVSQRQMERLFRQNVGLSIKRTASLVRYQKVWREIVLGEGGDIQDSVYRFGYSVQSHLLREFKRFHGVSPEEAKKIALTNR